MPRRLHLGLPSAPEQRHLVASLAGTTLLLWIGASAIVPLLPTFLHGHGASSALVGIVMASYFALAVLTQYPVGRLSDRIGRRPVMLGGLAVFIAGSIGFALVSGAGPAIAFRSLQGIGAGAFTVASVASVGERVAAHERGGSYALLYGSQSLALAVGPLLGSLIGATSMRLLFLGAAVFAAAGWVPIVALLGPSAPLADEGASPATSETAPALTYRFALFGAMVTFAAGGLLGGLYESCWSLLLHDRGASSVAIGLSWTLYCLPYAGLSAPAGRLADRRNRRRLAIAGLVTSACFALVYPQLHTVPLLVTLGCFEAVGAVLVTPAALSVVAEWTPRGGHGRSQGALETARTGTTAAAAAMCGALFGVRIFLPFVVASALLFAAAVGVGWSWRRLPPRVLPVANPGPTVRI